MVKVKYDKDKKEWIELEKGSKEGIYLDGFLKKRLDNVLYIQSKDWDCCFVIDGVEGSGKSTLGFICSYYLNPNLSLDNIAIDGNDALKKLEKLPDKSLLMVDEGALMFSSKDAMKREQKKLIQVISVIRQKNMVLIIVLPSYFELNKYLAVHRSRFLLHVYSTADLERGRFAYFGTKKKRVLYELGRKNNYSYGRPRSDFVGRFKIFDPFGKEYKELKRKSLLSTFQPERSTREESTRGQRNELIKLIYEKKWLSQTKIAEYLSMRGYQSDKTNISLICLGKGG